jgi:predicted ATPase/class 3 adenylate cyclase
MSVEPPTGTITFLFTDIEGSTRLWERQATEMSRALARHDQLVREAIEGRGGHVFKTVGDAFCAGFGSAVDAVAAALDVQLAMAGEPWGESPALVVRCALHTGTAERRANDYFGPTLNRAARLLSAGYGGQVLLSQATETLTQGLLPAGCDLRDLGTHRLRDIDRSERVWQLVHPELRADFPPIRTLRARHDNLPPQTTSFVGREHDRDALKSLLLNKAPKVVTLTGPGGAGKTRLALETASDCIDSFADGACFVPLAAIREPALVVPAIAKGLGLRESGERPLFDVLTSYLHAREVLLVLDNFEHLVDAAPVVGALLEAPRVRALVTSRAPLHLYGEHEVPVLSLATPAAAGIDPDVLAQCESARLFVERAQAVDSRFELNAENAPAVAEICRRLDGLPLAIELAAARIKLLTPRAMLDRLDSRLNLLVGGPRDMPERQQTMRATVEWSHALLDDEEQALFRRLAVFAGGFTLDAAEDVCGFDARTDVLAGVASLLDKSLLHRHDGAGGETRLMMLETVREFASERLEQSGELALARDRHGAWALRCAERASPEFHGPQQLARLASCEDDHDNFRVALAWLAEGSRAGDGLRLAVALAPFWELHSHLSEGHQWLERMLGGAGPNIDPRLRADALYWEGQLAMEAGDNAAARAFLDAAMACAHPARATRGRAMTTLGWIACTEGNIARALELCTESVALLRTAKDAWGLANALHYIGHMQWETTGPESAAESWEESLRLFRQLGDGWGLAQPLKDLGKIAAWRGDVELARRLYEESLALLREIGDKNHVADSLCRLGELSLLTGDAGDATARFLDALALSRDLDNKEQIFEVLMHYAEAAEVQSDHAGARRMLEEGLSIARDLGHDRLLAAALHNMAYLALHEREIEASKAMFAESLRLHRGLGRNLEVSMNLSGFAALALAQGEHEEAARLYGCSEALREAVGLALDRFDRLEFVLGQEDRIARTRTALGDAAFDRAWAMGRSLTREQALAEADALCEVAARPEA